jgi:hypothetical protein
VLGLNSKAREAKAVAVSLSFGPLCCAFVSAPAEGISGFPVLADGHFVQGAGKSSPERTDAEEDGEEAKDCDRQEQQVEGPGWHVVGESKHWDEENKHR